MRRFHKASTLLILLLVFGMLAAACGSDKKNDTKANGSTNGTQPTPSTQKKGGSIVLGAEQWPDCINPIDQCANSSWMHWVADEYVLPKLMYLNQKNEFAASPLLEEAPSLDNGLITANPFTVTYKLNKDAVWDDGSPITSKDIEFSWHAQLDTKETLSTVGYDKITSIDTTDPKTAIVKYSEPFADWADVFGGNSNYVLKAAYFGGNTDTSSKLQDSIPFSGTMWKLQSFSKEQSVLVPNDKYWVAKDKPLLDKVTFVPKTDQDTEINALRSKEVWAIYPQPSPEYSKNLDQTGITFKTGGGTTYEGLWMNLSKKPLDDVKVRQAVMQATNRQNILDTIIHPDTPDLKLLNCGGWVPTVGKFCNDDFGDLKFSIDDAKKTLEDDGWKVGSDGIREKAGVKLNIPFNTVRGNTRREAIQQLVQQDYKAAGIGVTIQNFDSTNLFQDVLPKLGHGLAIYAQVASPDPSVTSIFACENIPKAPDYAGQNNSAWCNQSATDDMHSSDKEVDPDKRLALIHKVGKAVRDDYVWYPFYQLPLIIAWRSDLLEGPIDAYTTSVYTAFWNINKWSVK